MDKDRDTISMIPNWQLGLVVVAWTVMSMVIGAAFAAMILR